MTLRTGSGRLSAMCMASANCSAGVALGDEMAEIHLPGVYRLGNEAEVLVGVHVVGLEVQLMLLVHAVGEAYAVLHEGVLDELAAPAADLSRLLEGRSVAVGEEDEVRAHAPRELHDALVEVLAAAVAGELGAHLAGLLEVEVRHVAP